MDRDRRKYFLDRLLLIQVEKVISLKEKQQCSAHQSERHCPKCGGQMEAGVATASGLPWAMQTHMLVELILLVSPRLEEESLFAEPGIRSRRAAEPQRKNASWRLLQSIFLSLGGNCHIMTMSYSIAYGHQTGDEEYRADAAL